MNSILWPLLIMLACVPLIHVARVVLMAKKRARAHEVLLRRVMRLRLYKMMKFLGLNADEYLRTTSGTDINQQTHRCVHCKALDNCNTCLNSGERIVQINFCPNHKSLTEVGDAFRPHRLE